MLTATRQSDSLRVLARDVERSEGPFACPTCATEMILHKGQIRVHHFAHKPPVTCALGVAETEAHLRAKLAIFDGLRGQPNVTGLELEMRLPGAVADVFAVISGVPVAVEVQRSVVGTEDIAARTVNYHRQGIAVIWVALHKEELNTDRYAPTAWERWCHTANFGRVYYWLQGQTLRPVHFSDFKLHVPETSWRKDGEDHSAGGYDKRSKRWVRPMSQAPVSLSAHFRRKVREAWSGGKAVLPQCTLFVDHHRKWWP